MLGGQFCLPDDSFDDIEKVLNSDDCNLENLFDQKNIEEALKRPNHKLIQFIITNIVELTQVALTEINNPRMLIIQKIFLSPVPSLTQKISQTPVFIDCLSNYLFSATITPIKLRYFCSIARFFVKFTNGYFLLQIQNRSEFFKKLFEYIQFFYVYDLINEISADGHPYFTQYLENINAHLFVWNRLQSSPQDCINYIILKNIISSASPNSQMLFYLADTTRFPFIFNQAINTENKHLSSVAMDLVYELCSHCDEEDCENENSLFQLIFIFLLNKFNAISQFIIGRHFFTNAKLKAIELLSGLISINDEEVPDSLIDAAGNLISQIFDYPVFSKLHCAALNFSSIIFSTGANIEPILLKYDIKTKIADAFKTYSKEKPYYGHLLKITEMILEIESDQQKNEKWESYIKNEYAQMKTILDSNYGGTVPPRLRDQIGFDDRYI